MEVRNVDLYEAFGMERRGAAGGRLTCMTWRPLEEAGVGRESPAVLILPGGGYCMTSEREAEAVALQFSALGYQTFVLAYSCAPSVFPTALRECAMAMTYIRRSAKGFGVIPNMVAAVGFSAGGHLCGTLGTLYDSPEVADIAPAEWIRPDALGLSYPVAVSWGSTHEGSFQALCGENRDLRSRLSLEKLVRPDMPPVFLWHTRDDGAVPVRNSLILAQAMEEKGVSFALHIYRSGPHGVSLANELVYPANHPPVCSRDVSGWQRAMADFWAECGFACRDRGGPL